MTRRPVKMRFLSAWLLAAVGMALGSSPAHAFMEDTRLFDLRAGTSLSRSVNSLQGQGYELSDGSRLTFGDWYRADFPDTHVQFLTAVAPDFGVIWGFGTGESGGQYEIEPSLHLGLLATAEISPRETFSFSVHGVFGGHLSERPCTAGYGRIGGVQKVNCRLAATTMRPSDTLRYLFDESPSDRLTIRFRYAMSF